ncbi:type I polyketide synthase [Microcystis sp. T1-4]|jgi:acyl transferase domain-containing protein/acyl-CoA synthetase (AMP-forming)/AMP-acid ligase II/acyl carrier protein|uniref:type I polyketide synthase n=1 Tax=Microcystis sp. T1-4 TaxID=1160279 RepID=UPI0002622F5B|nr:type I polyketide synthase [Microcystis sp. T1-4]CCI31025.1 Beta-ketoacyl synthase [Microcystis sp. T1-4]
MMTTNLSSFSPWSTEISSGDRAEPVTLVKLLKYRAVQQPNQIAYHFLTDNQDIPAKLTYAQLDRKAGAIAACLQRFHPENQCVLLLYPAGLDYIAAFFGCLYAGMIAVPAYHPKPNRSLERIKAIMKDSQSKIALTTSEISQNLERCFEFAPELKDLSWLTTDQIDGNLADQWQEPRINPEDIAYLQYTSGSTCTPKGVMISHQNALHNTYDMAQTWDISGESVIVSWLPHFHDFGLVFGILEPFYSGCSTFLMSPESFVQKPQRWLEAIAQYRGTHTGAPNFAYELCVEKSQSIRDAHLDLSSWRVAVNGAEPIYYETLEKFVTAFASLGVSWETLSPGYGLAEATLKICSVPHGQAPRVLALQRLGLEQKRVVELPSSSHEEANKVIGCGRPILGCQIVIVDPETHIPCPPDGIGEIWVSGASIAQGYWQRSETSFATFQAYLETTNEGPYLRTGDLGFLKDGELFVMGRLKDLIIIRGRNHYPQDLELTAQNSHPALRLGFAAAFAVTVNHQEQLVLTLEVKRQFVRKLNTEEVVEAVRRAIAEHHEIEVYAVVLLKTGSIPKTSSGKIQRYACRSGFEQSSLTVIGQWQAPILTEETGKETGEEFSSVGSSVLFVEAIRQWLVNWLSEKRQLTLKEINIQESFSNYGLNSLQMVNLAADLGKLLDKNVSPTLLWDYPSISELADYLGEKTGTSPVQSQTSQSEPSDSAIIEDAIAIIGLGCRFPNANNINSFWYLLSQGIDAIRRLPSERSASLHRTMPDHHPALWGGFLDLVDQFDSSFFGIAPREAARMDPQQRLLLEVAWEAFENAGVVPDQLAGSRTGVFVGLSTNDHSHILLRNPENLDAYVGTGSANSMVANRLSYLLDLRGPSMTVDTACSSSLVAVHMACQNLKNHESDLALAAGINLILTPDLTLALSQAQMMSPEGRCKTFDADADGYVRGEGCGVVVLKRLKDAMDDGDAIYAVIRGSAINQDGRSNGITAPNGLAQQSIIREALAKAQIKPEQISYIEAHGTGTPLGDPIEVDALKAVFDSNRPVNHPYWVGSVKTNIGHLEAAAGIAGLIKVALCLHHREIPAHLHLKQVNPHISLDNTSLEFVKTHQPWVTNTDSLYAGVSSFGFGGTNCHVVLQEAPQLSVTSDVKADLPLLFTLSAKNESSLQALVAHYTQWLTEHPNNSLANLCFTTNTGRSHFSHRLAVVAKTQEELKIKLQRWNLGEFSKGVTKNVFNERNVTKIAFLFTGQGSQYVGMGQQLWETEPIFQEAFRQCEALFRPYLSESLLSVIYPQEPRSTLINQTQYTQAALFSFEYALAKLWQAWGIQPTAVIGHSLGEYVAACIANVFSLEDAVKLVAKRGQLIQNLPANGTMAMVALPADSIVPYLDSYQQKVVIATRNSPQNTVISGESIAVNQIVEMLRLQGIATKILSVSHAFHSPLMVSIIEEFAETVKQVTFNVPQIPLISNYTGRVAYSEEICQADYWCNHLLHTVDFQGGLQSLVKLGVNVCLEIGPKPTLVSMGKQCGFKDVIWLDSVKLGEENWQTLINTLSILYTEGCRVNWANLYCDATYQKLHLPTYAFNRKHYPILTVNHHANKEKDESSILPVVQPEEAKILNSPSSQLLEVLTQQAEALIVQSKILLSR